MYFFIFLLFYISPHETSIKLKNMSKQKTLTEDYTSAQTGQKSAFLLILVPSAMGLWSSGWRRMILVQKVAWRPWDQIWLRNPTAGKLSFVVQQYMKTSFKWWKNKTANKEGLASLCPRYSGSLTPFTQRLVDNGKFLLFTFYKDEYFSLIIWTFWFRSSLFIHITIFVYVFFHVTQLEH